MTNIKDTLTVCCECGLVEQKVNDEKYWVLPGTVPHFKQYYDNLKISHGYCPMHYAEAQRKVDEEFKQ